MKFLYRLAFRYGKYAVKNIVGYIVAGMAVVYLLEMLLYSTGRLTVPLSLLLDFNRDAVFAGQLWRLFTFLFVPPEFNVIFLVFALMMYYILGQGLEQEWGAPQLNLYLLIGYIGTLIGGLITGGATNQYIYLSMFFAFAVFYPNFELRIFFIIPVKIKYLAILDAILYIYMLVVASLPYKVSILISLANLLLFFWRQAYDRAKLQYVHLRSKWRYNRR